VIVYDSKRGGVRLGHSIGQGGEATVYLVEGRPELLAKIFEPGPRPNYEDKLAWMIAHPPENPTATQNHASLAWPVDLLYSEDRRLRGYLMPYIRHAVPALMVFNPRRRARVLPSFDRRYLYRAARNLATAVASLHLSGYVVGDLNESNALINPSALVTLIDTDSFQVQAYSRSRLEVHHCPVGKMEYTPPELHGRHLQEVTRLPEHDHFALAVLIFQLLMEGSHPFRAQWLGSGDPPPLETRIQQGMYPYLERPTGPVRPPKSAASLDHLHPDVSALFRRCFQAGHSQPSQRPGAQEWRRALREAEKALRTCGRGHTYSVHLAGCPACSQRTAAQGSQPRRSGGQPNPARQQSRPAEPQSPPQTGRQTQPPAPFWQSRPAKQPASRPAPLPKLRRPQSQPQWGPLLPSPQARTALRLIWRVIQSYPLAPLLPGQPAPAGAGAGSSSSPAPAAPASPASYPARQINLPPAIGVGAWIKPRLQKSLLFGSSTGALAGALPGSLLGMSGWEPAQIAAWTLVWMLGGAAAGIWRGWRPGFRLGNWIGRAIGWERFWNGAGTAGGALIGATLGMFLWWLVIPVILGFIGGARLGSRAGRKLWLAGYGYGWERIMALLGSTAAALTGAAFAGLVGASLVGGYLETSVDALLDWIFISGGNPLWLATLTGAIGGALGGAATGFFSDLTARLTGLVD
jgi:serine/threonine protein kinase